MYSMLVVLGLIQSKNFFNQIFHYTHCIMPNHVSSLQGSYLHHCRLCPDNTAPFKEMSQQWQAFGNTVFDLNLEPPAPVMSALQLVQHAGFEYFFILMN